MLERLWGKGTPHTLLAGMNISIAAVEGSVESPQNIKTRTATWDETMARNWSER